jgi:ATP-binding cassette, subfamily C, bacterial CydC
MIAAALRRYRRRAAAAILLGAATICAGIGLLATSGYLISRAALEPPILTLTVAIVGVRFFAILRALLRYAERLVSHDLAFRHLADLRVRFYERLVPLAPAGLRHFRSADLLSRFVGDVDSLQHLFPRALAPPLVAVGAIVVAIGVAAAILPAAALVLALALLLAASVVPAVGWAVTRRSGRRQAGARAELTGELVELLRAAPELAVYGGADERRRRVLEADARLTRLARRDALASGLTGALGMLLASSSAAAVLAVAVPAVAGGDLGGVNLAVLAFLALSSFEAVAPLPAAAQQRASAAGVAGRLGEIATAPAPVADPEKPRPAGAAPVLRIEHGRLRYEADGPWVLDGVDLELAPGRRIALVGPSGSGKSTIARVLVRFCDLTEGRATLDGHDLREYAGDDVRRVVALHAEDAHLFATSIRDNVRIGRSDAADAEILTALARAGAAEWIATLPDGLDTLVGEEGALVSGGQRQRIALARALLARAPILILDEPTAHLDESTAAAFIDDLIAATEDIGLLLITHRPHGLDRFDEVITLGGGRVADRATPAANAPGSSRAGSRNRGARRRSRCRRPG